MSLPYSRAWASLPKAAMAVLAEMFDIDGIRITPEFLQGMRVLVHEEKLENDEQMIWFQGGAGTCMQAPT